MSKKVEVKVTIIVQDDVEYITFDEDGEIKQHFEHPERDYDPSIGTVWYSGGQLPVRAVPLSVIFPKIKG